MLVLSRRKGETVVIGEKIRISIQELSRGRVKLGIDAPWRIRIARGELYRTAADPQSR